AYVPLAALPLTGNGKIDRKALPDPGMAVTSRQDFVPPQGPLETAIAGLWSEVLGVERVGRHDSFFELGGQSLLVVRMISRLRQSLGFDLALSSVFAHPVLHEFAQAAGVSQAVALPALVPVARPDDMPLSFAQQRLWLAAQFGEEASAAYHMPIGLRLHGRLDRAALQAALDGIVRRHEALRTRFELVDDHPVQRIAPVAPFGLVFQALDLDVAERDAAIAHWSLLESREPFDLHLGPLFRGRLLRLGEHDHALLLTVHHIVSDGWSLGVLADELSTLYSAYAVEGVPFSSDPLPPLPVQYADYALWQRQCMDDAMQAHLLAYWRDQLAGSPTLSTLPTDHPRPPTKGFVGGMVHAQVPPSTTAALNALAAGHSSTLFMVLMAAFKVVLSRYTGQTDLNVGTVVANRSRAEVEPLIGLFLDTQAIRTRLDPAQSFESLLAQVRATLIQAYLHQDLPFDRLLEELKPARRPGVPPVFQVMVQMQSVPDPVVHLPDLRMEELPLAEHTVKFDLTLYVNERAGAIDIAYEYDAALYDAATIERLADRFARMLDAVAATPQARIDVLALPEVLPAAVRRIDASPQRGTAHELSPMQRRLWPADADASASATHLPLLLSFDGPVSSTSLADALNVVVARHEALRTWFSVEDGRVRQSVLPVAPLVLAERTLEDGESLLTQFMAEMAHPFRLDDERPLRATVWRDANGHAWLCLMSHRLVVDRRSLALIAGEITSAYAAIEGGGAPTAPVSSPDFGDYLHWLSTLDDAALEPLRMYWKQPLRGALPTLALPTSRPRQAAPGFAAASHVFAIGADLGAALRALAQGQGVDVEDTLLAGFMALLARYGGQDDLVVGLDTDGRRLLDLQVMVGPLADVLPLRVAIPAGGDARHLLADVSRARTHAMQHGNVPFERIAAAMGLGEEAQRNGLCDVVFRFDGRVEEGFHCGERVVRMVDTGFGEGRCDLHLSLSPCDGGYAARLVYDTALFDEWFVVQMMRHFVRLLQAMALDPAIRIDHAPVLDAAERNFLSQEWNATDRAYPTTCVHAQFSAQAARTPEAVALRFEDIEL
ncbi:condensation domain-containing protein, partial [Lysobacter tyrosinilyticus]